MIWNYSETSELKMKNFSAKQLFDYLEKIKTETLLAYGVYQVEADGLELFEYIKGDTNSIMGLPIKEIITMLKNIIDNDKKFGIIGNPIDHSLSPILHNYWFQKYKIDANYSILNVKENELSSIVEKIKIKASAG